MKILQVITRFGPKHSGGAIVVSDVSVYMAKRGHEVTIITTDHEGDEKYNENIRKEGVEVITFRCICPFLFFFPSPNMKRWLSKNIKNYDVVHLNCARSYQNNIVYKYAKKYSISYILQAHGSVLRIIERQTLKKLYDYVWGYKIWKDTTKVIALNRTEAEAYKMMGVTEDKIEIIPNGIDLSKFSNPPEKGEFRKKYSIPNDEKIVLYLGRLHKSKGLDLLIEAFSELATELDTAKLMLIGPDGGDRLLIEKRAEDLNIGDMVIFTGLVPDKEKMMAFIDADVFVTPRFYGFPITFLEAMACGTPIVTTNAGDFIEGIDNEVGYVTRYDEKELKNALLKVLTDEKLKNSFKEKAKKKSKGYSWDRIVGKLEKVYEEVKGDSFKAKKR